MGSESLCSTDNRTDEDNREGLRSSNGIDDCSQKQPISLAQAERECRKIALGHYENFLVATVFLPRKMRQPFYNVYAFCRTADDLADLSPNPEIATTELLRWQSYLRECFSGHAQQPIFVALRDTVTRFNLAIEPFESLLQAFLQDQKKTQYASFDELLGYCQNSANPVGRIVLRLADADTVENVSLSDSICTGLQLANHWQDVARDLDSGRVYLPAQDMQSFGLDLENLRSADQRENFRKLIKFQCERADDYLRKGLPLANRVPSWLANDIRLFIHGGLATLQGIARIDYDVLDKRPTVSKIQQLRLIMAALLGRL